MSFDTVVDKAQLEGAITASANAIRVKTGSTEMVPWDADTGFEDAISAIEAGGGASRKPVILEVEKITSGTKLDSTTYSDEVFILLDIYPKSGGTVTVTYGDLTKTITDASGADEPEPQQVFFGTFNGVSDEVETPESGTLTIDGDYAAFGVGCYEHSKNGTSYCGCITAITQFGDIEYIPDYAFNGCSKLEVINIPYNVTEIGEIAFQNCGVTSLNIPYGTTTICDGFLYQCNALRDIILPSTVTTIDDNAFFYSNLFCITIPENVTYIGDSAFLGSKNLVCIRILATTPPELGGVIIKVGGSSAFTSFTVPSGCGEAYKTDENWSRYADYIVEEIVEE